MVVVATIVVSTLSRQVVGSNEEEIDKGVRVALVRGLEGRGSARGRQNPACLEGQQHNQGYIRRVL